MSERRPGVKVFENCIDSKLQMIERQGGAIYSELSDAGMVRMGITRICL